MTNTTKTTTATPTYMWLVVEGRWGIDGIPGIFSTEELAKNYMKEATKAAEKHASLHKLHHSQMFDTWEVQFNPVFGTESDEYYRPPLDENTGGDDA